MTDGTAGSFCCAVPSFRAPVEKCCRMLRVQDVADVQGRNGLGHFGTGLNEGDRALYMGNLTYRSVAHV